MRIPKPTTTGIDRREDISILACLWKSDGATIDSFLQDHDNHAFLTADGDLHASLEEAKQHSVQNLAEQNQMIYDVLEIGKNQGLYMVQRYEFRIE